jgi:hypothetical protein
MSLKYYGLSGHEVVEVDAAEWAALLEDHDARRVAFDRVGESEVSTVFVGVDLRLDDRRGRGRPPLVFETMVFGESEGNPWRGRYATWEEAEAGHREAVARIAAGEM